MKITLGLISTPWSRLSEFYSSQSLSAEDAIFGEALHDELVFLHAHFQRRAFDLVVVVLLSERAAEHHALRVELVRDSRLQVRQLALQLVAEGSELPVAGADLIISMHFLEVLHLQHLADQLAELFLVYLLGCERV